MPMRSLPFTLSARWLALLMLSVGAACGPTEEQPPACEDVTCGDNASCSADTGECVCDTGFADVDGACVNKRQVACADESPANAVSITADVEISFDGTAWSAPAACEWACSTQYDLVDGACVNEREVACADNPPANAESTSSDPVTITYDGTSWSAPAACSWACVDGYDDVDGACVNQLSVSCADVAPANATSAPATVTITYDGTSWSTPAACLWVCDSGFDEIDGACLNEQLVSCADAAPQNATSTPATVTITYDGTAWSAPAACAWTCDSGFDAVAGACVNTQDVACRDVAPGNATSVSALVTITYDGTTWSTPDACEWGCDTGYDQVDEACLNARFVACTDAPPANATTTDATALVEITFDGTDWSAPGACPWSCDAGFADIDGTCLAARLVTCTDDPPANATTTDATAQVEITFDGTDWSTPGACPWACETGYGEVDGACLDSRMVACDDVSPQNATSTIIQVEISYDGTEWSKPDACEWACDTGFDEIGGECLNVQLVGCIDEAPANATSTLAEVEITFDGTEWSEPAACAWTCDQGFRRDDGACVPDIVISHCYVHSPVEVEAETDEVITFKGVVESNATGTAAEAGLTAKWCWAPEGLTPNVKLADLTCQDATESSTLGVPGHEFSVDGSFAVEGLYESLFAFSADGGTTWTLCDVNGELDGVSIDPALALVTARAWFGDFERWTVDGNGDPVMPEGWSKESGIGVAREEVDVRSGSYAARLTRNSTNNGSVQIESPVLPVTPGRKYEARYWFLDTGNGARARGQYQAVDANGANVGSTFFPNHYTSNSNDWQLYTFTFTAPANSAGVRLGTRVYADGGAATGGSVVLDDVDLVEID